MLIKSFRIRKWHVGIFSSWLGFSRRFHGSVIDFGFVKLMSVKFPNE